MPDDATKKPSQSDKTDRAANPTFDSLPDEPLSDRDAESVKGGMMYDDESPKKK